MAGNNEKLQAMYEEYQAVLRRVAVKNGVPYDDVDDVVQETFLEYFRHYPVDWTPKQKKAMLMRILKNKCIDFYRRNRRITSVSMDSEEFDETMILRSYMMADTLERVIADETLNEIHENIRNLKKDWRDIAVLHLVEHRSIAEVCEILELDASVCRTRLFRIRKYLKSMMEHVIND